MSKNIYTDKIRDLTRVYNRHELLLRLSVDFEIEPLNINMVSKTQNDSIKKKSFANMMGFIRTPLVSLSKTN